MLKIADLITFLEPFRDLTLDQLAELTESVQGLLAARTAFAAQVAEEAQKPAPEPVVAPQAAPKAAAKKRVAKPKVVKAMQPASQDFGVRDTDRDVVKAAYEDYRVLYFEDALHLPMSEIKDRVGRIVKSVLAPELVRIAGHYGVEKGTKIRMGAGLIEMVEHRRQDWSRQLGQTQHLPLKRPAKAVAGEPQVHPQPQA